MAIRQVVALAGGAVLAFAGMRFPTSLALTGAFAVSAFLRQQKYDETWTLAGAWLISWIAMFNW